jgi:nucleoside-diphosphate-sugar epimerase
MKCLIVGCGYVGLPLAKELVRLGHEVFGLRRNPVAEGGWEAAGIRPLIADITRPDEPVGLPDGFDWVVNCVASRGGDVEEYRRIYLQGTRHLLDWLSAKPPQKFVYTSSTSVYGQTDGSWVKETSPTEPLSKTARVLLETEESLLGQSGSRVSPQGGTGCSPHQSMPVVILRVAGIYGPERGHGFKQFLKNEARLEGDGSRFLNMIHRDDVIGCVIAALKNGRAGEVYNVVDDEPVSQMNFFQWLAEELGKELPPVVPENSRENRRRGVTNKRVSNRKLKTELGYPFKYPDFRSGYTEEISRLEQAGELPE